MTFYRSQKLSAIAVYNRNDGMFLGMVRLVALEKQSNRLERNEFEKADAVASGPADYEIRWYPANKFDHHPLQSAQKHDALPEFLSPIFNNFASSLDSGVEATETHVFIQCEPWSKPAPMLEQDVLVTHTAKMPSKVA